MRYDLLFNGSKAGNVLVEREGLYYSVRCRCQNIGRVMRLVLVLPSGNRSLGICGPVSGGFGLDKRIAVKQMPRGRWHFALEDSQAQEVPFFPMDRQLPDELILQLERLRFAEKEGVPGLIIADRTGDR